VREIDRALKRQLGNKAQARIVNPEETATGKPEDLERGTRLIENNSGTEKLLKSPQRQRNELGPGHGWQANKKPG
jgi:hypothetical protein